MFSLYMNDLENDLSVNGTYCLEIYDNDLNVYLKLFVLLYADDTVVFATSEETLIQELNVFSNYCNQWKLDINYDKTQVLVLGDRINRQRHISIENHQIEIVNILDLFSTKPKVFFYEKACCKSSKENTIPSLHEKKKAGTVHRMPIKTI